MHRALPLVSTLVFSAPALAASLPEAERQLLVGDEAGALTNPRGIEDAAALAAICAAVRAPRTDGVVPEAAVAVYKVNVPAGGFRLSSDGSTLAIDLDHALQAHGGQLHLVALDRTSGRFEVTASEAADLRARADTLTLDVEFRLEGRDSGLPACFGHPKSASMGLRIEPLAFELRDSAAEATLARVRTPARAELAARIDPGAASLRVEVRTMRGRADPTALEEKLRDATIAACLRPVMQHPAATGLVSFMGTVSPAGGLTGLSAQIIAFEDDAIVACLQDALGALSVGRGAGGAQLSMLFSVDRGR